MARGYKAFLVVIHEGLQYGLERLAGFRQEAVGCRVGVIRQGFAFQSSRSTPDKIHNFVEEIGEVIEDYPMETGIFAINDWIAGIVQRTLKPKIRDENHGLHGKHG